MSKKISLTAIVISALLISLVAGLSVVEVTKANFIPTAYVNTIWSPTNKTYSSSSLSLNVTVTFALTENRSIAYSLDGNENVTLTGIQYQIDNLWQGINITGPLPALSEGSHRLDVYAKSIPASYASPDSKTVFFTIDTTSPTLTPIPTSSPTLNVSLSESASALNYGSTINFTVSADGGTKPYTFAWYVDGQMAQTSASQYFSTNSQAVGSHHVYVQVTDADNNSATTLTVEFNVLPASSSSPGLSPTLSSSPTQQPTPTPTAEPFPAPLVITVVIVVVIATIVLVVLIIVGLLRYIVKSKKVKS